MTSKLNLFQEVKFVGVQLNPGDALYLPKGYWHAVESTVPSSSAINWYFDDDSRPTTV
jgi:hypothetical protein